MKKVPGALSEAECLLLAEQLGANDCMEMEALDGFFCALAASPILMLPSEFLEFVRTEGGGGAGADQGLDLDESTIMLILRYWNEVCRDFSVDKLHEPFLFEPDESLQLGEAWANGYLYGVSLHQDQWNPVIEGDLNPWFGLLLALAGHAELSTAERAKLFSGATRPDILCGALAAKAYELFAPARKARASGPEGALAHDTVRFSSTTLTRTQPKIGRNDPCPCGSGRKYKQCCSVKSG